MKRPVMSWVILFVLGVLFGTMYTKHQLVIVFILCAFLFCIKHKKSFFIRISVCFFILGILNVFFLNNRIRRFEQYNEKIVQVHGFVIKKEVSTKKKYVVKTKSINRQSVQTSILCETDYDYDVGMLVQIKGVAQMFEPATNFGGFDERAYRYSNGIYFRVVDGTNIAKPIPEKLLFGYLYQVKDGLSHIYYEWFCEKNASLACAMVLGEKQNLDQEIKALYQENGIAHLLTISGLHIAMIGGTIYRILRKMIGRYDVSAMLGCVFILLYGGMTGLVGATLRAIIMLMVLIGADVAGRKYDSLSAISLALFLMLLWRPYQIFQAGFLLSFGAVLGIAFLVPVFQELFEKWPKWLMGLQVSISVQIMTLPILLWFYYEIPFWSVLLNLFVVPLMSILLCCLLLCGVWGMFLHALPADILLGFEWIEYVSVWICERIFDVYEGLCLMCNQLPFHTMCTGRPSVFFVLFYYGCLGVFLILFHNVKRERKKIWLCAEYSLIWIAMFFSLWLPKDLTICMFDVGQGDGIYIQLPNRIHILVDGGSSSNKQVGRYVLQNGIAYYGADHLDYAFVTHSDWDHYSGIYQILEEDLLPIRCLVLPAIQNPDEKYQGLEIMARERGTKLCYLQRGDILQMGEVSILCWNPQNDVYDDANQGSMCLELCYRSFQYLMTADIDMEVEQELLHTDMWKENEIEVLKIAHHGSASSSSSEWIRKLQPKLALLSVGRQNRYGHPAKETLQRFYEEKVPIYRTDVGGAILIRTNGKEIRCQQVYQEERIE